VAAKRDRLARDIGVISIIASETKKAGATIRTADGASDAKGSRGVIERGMHDIFSEYERAVISERTSAALAVKKARGERVGMVPFGYRVAADGVRLEPLATEQAILSTVRELRAANASTYGIARELTARGLISRALKPFAQTQIVRMLKPRVPGA
jgi:site-specific DNA recombinase